MDCFAISTGLKISFVISTLFACRSQSLQPNEKSQQEMMVGGLAEIINRVADGNEMIFCLNGTDNCFEPSAHYGIDGVTEKVPYSAL